MSPRDKTPPKFGEDMSTEEWESICDGCGQCCLIDRETCVACPLFNTTTRRCGNYRKRTERETCVKVTPENMWELHELTILPDSCAYVRAARGLEPAPNPVEAVPFYKAPPLIQANYEVLRRHWFADKMYERFNK
jgi:hypothetical protein